VLLGAAEARPDPRWLMPPIWAADPTLRRLFELAVAGKSEHEALSEIGGGAELDPELGDWLKSAWNKVSDVAIKLIRPPYMALALRGAQVPADLPPPPTPAPIVELRRDDPNPLTGPPPPPR
jgi:hypothetical protein